MTHRFRAAAATAFAPATVANVAVGFDVLGFALEAAGDRVRVSRDTTGTTVQIESITGVVTDLPMDPKRNTASVALGAMIEGEGLDHGFKIVLDKGIPLGSGMGGSAASAVAAVVAANQLIELPLPRHELLRYAVAGERAASGAPHADNAAPCLYGGLTAVVATDPLEVVSIPVPQGLLCVLVHPHLRLDTRQARAVLSPQLPLSRHVAQSMRLCGFIAGCFRGDLGLIGRSMVDLVAEPSRASLIPGFAQARAAALECGALGFGIAGSGPSVFAWTDLEAVAHRVKSEVERCFGERGIAADSFVGPIAREGAAVLSTESAGS